MDYKGICDRLRYGRKFTFSRFGDGEWHAILQDRAGEKNCDGHSYFPMLGLRLGSILKRKPGYLVGMQPLAKKLMGVQIEEWLSANVMGYIEWENADILHDASKSDRLELFFSAVKGKEILVVGPIWLKHLPATLMEFQHIVVPEFNSWSQYESILKKTKDKVEEGMIVMVSMGMGGKVLVDELYGWKGDRLTIVDTGSVFDYYCGRLSRKYMVEMVREDMLCESQEQ